MSAFDVAYQTLEESGVLQRVYFSLTEAYLRLLKDVHERPDYKLAAVTPDDTKGSDDPVTRNPNWYMNRAASRELTNVGFVLVAPAEDSIITTHCEARNRVIRDYAAAETVAFDTGDDEALKALSAVWRKIQNPDGTVNANYGRMVYHTRDAGHPAFGGGAMMSQWAWVIAMLRLSKDSNQAYMHFNRPKDQWSGNLDQPCCMYAQFMIREHTLDLHVNYRSNDLVFGFPYNMLYFIKLLHRMLRELREFYPALKLGSLHYHAASLHHYERHAALVEAMLGKAR